LWWLKENKNLSKKDRGATLIFKSGRPDLKIIYNFQFTIFNKFSIVN